MITSLYICSSLMIGSMLLVMFIIPQLITYMQSKKLFDLPGGRKGHKAPTPTAGGIAIFIAILVSALSFSVFFDMHSTSLILSIFVLFLIGLKDDLIGMKALPKLMIQSGLAILTVSQGLFLNQFFDAMLGISLPYFVKAGFSIVLVIGLTNAYNMIDGVDGLAGSLGIIAMLVLGFILSMVGQLVFAILAFAAAGGLLGFLKFNLHQARIFMGDTGSLVIGFLLAILLMVSLENIMIAPISNPAPYIMALTSIVLVPVFDLCQVIIKRLAAGKHPFSADRRHLHHQLLQSGLNPLQVTSSLSAVTLSLVGYSFLISNFSYAQGIFSLVMICLGAYALLQFRLQRNQFKSSSLSK